MTCQHVDRLCCCDALVLLAVLWVCPQCQEGLQEWTWCTQRLNIKCVERQINRPTDFINRPAGQTQLPVHYHLKSTEHMCLSHIHAWGYFPIHSFWLTKTVISGFVITAFCFIHNGPDCRNSITQQRFHNNVPLLEQHSTAAQFKLSNIESGHKNKSLPFVIFCNHRNQPEVKYRWLLWQRHRSVWRERGRDSDLVLTPQ